MPIATIAFATALMALLISGHLARQEGAGNPWPNRLLAGYFALFGLQQLLLSFQLQAGDIQLGTFRVALMLGANPIAYLFFESLRTQGPFRPRPRFFIHFAPLALVPLLALMGMEDWLDPLLSLSLIGYAAWFTYLAGRGASQFAHLRTFASTARRWLLAFAVFFAMSALLDLIIAAQVNAAGAIEASAMLQLVAPTLLLAVSFLLFGSMGDSSVFDWLYERSLQSSARTEREPVAADLMVRIEETIKDPKTYTDANLTISRFAKRLSVPARSVSIAVNDGMGLTFSQLLSQTRINAAKEMIGSSAEESKSVLEIAYAVGFGSKSNFNKEFKRQTGMTPTEFRRSAND